MPESFLEHQFLCVLRRKTTIKPIKSDTTRSMVPYYLIKTTVPARIDEAVGQELGDGRQRRLRDRTVCVLEYGN